MHVGLLFGSFNPVHNGHLIIAQSLLLQCKWDEVWFVLSPQSPFKAARGLLAFEHRCLLLKNALRHEPHIKVCEIEAHLPVPSYTVDTMQALTDKYPDFSFHIIMGSDQLESLHRWKYADVLLEKYPIHIYCRPGFSSDQQKYPHLKIHELSLLDISATEIRKRMANKLSVTGMVHPAVEALTKAYAWYYTEL